MSEAGITYTDVIDYEERRRAAYARVTELRLRRSWVADAIGRSARCVTEVLRGTDTGAPTLLLVEDLIERIGRGEVEVGEAAIARPGRPRKEGADASRPTPLAGVAS